MVKIFKILLGLILVLGALFILTFIITMGEYSVPKTVSEDPSIPHVTIKGVTFHTETFGDPANPVVIVVHGGPGWDYRSLLPLKDLSDEFYVVFYDQRGTGLSPRVAHQTFTLESSLEDLDLIVDYFTKGKKVSLIGHSWGAMLVSGYVGKHPQKVSHAVLAEPGFLTTDMIKEAGINFGPKLELGFILHAAKVWFQSLHIKSPDEYASSDYFLGEVAPYANPEYYCNGVIPDVGTKHWRVGSLSMQSVMDSVMDSDGNIDIDLTKGIDKYTNQVLFIASECNTKIGLNYQKKQMKFFPNATLVVIKGSGHMMFGEKPVESIRVVREYLKNNKNPTTN